MTLPKEDPTRRKRFKKLKLTEGSAVTRGGNQFANVLIVRESEPEEEAQVAEEPKSFFSSVLGLFRKEEEVTRGGDKDDSPLTTSEILQQREMTEKIGRIESSFYTSLYRILYSCKGKEQIEKLQRTVKEFGSEMEKAIPEVTQAVDRMADDGAMKKKKKAKKSGAEEDEEEKDEIAEEVKKSVKRFADITRIVFESEDILTEAQVESIARLIPEEFTSGREDGQGGEMKLQDALALVTDPAAKEAIQRALEGNGDAAAETPKVEDVIRTLDDNSAKVVQSVVEQNRALESTVESLTRRLEDIEKRDEQARIERVAEEFRGLKEDHAEVIRAISDAAKVGEDTEKLVVESFRSAKQAKDAAEKALDQALMGEIGTTRSAPKGGAMETVDRMFTELKEKHPETSDEVLMARIFTENPNLAEAYDAEDPMRQRPRS